MLSTSHLFRAIGAGLFILLGIWGIVPAFTGRFHSGCMALVALGAAGVWVCARFSQAAALCCRLWQSGFGKAALCTAGVVVTAGLVLFVTLSCFMVSACRRAPAQNATLIVLGAALRGDKPSTLLKGRLDQAVLYLNAHPQSVCVVSGGQGPDELCTEASAMKTYLIRQGIAAERIFTEETSKSTFENIRNSKIIIEQNGLPSAVAIVTQEFHQYRARAFAKQAGFSHVGAVTAATPFHLLGSYWVRDVAGICHMALFGK